MGIILPPKVQYGVDGAAAMAAFAHFWGWWSGNVAAIASTAALIWILVQGVYFLKDRKKKK